jgi:hypothetical protein
MPRGPRGEKRPADVIGAAVMVAKRHYQDLWEQTKTQGPRNDICPGSADSPQRRTLSLA